MQSFVDLLAALAPGGIIISVLGTWLVMRSKNRADTQSLNIKHKEEMERLRLDRDSQVYLRLEKENERISRENTALRDKVDALSKQVSDLRAQMIKAGLAPALWDGSAVNV